jgi:hypothetical protein
MMRTEVGKYYRTRDGEKAYAAFDDGSDRWPIKVNHNGVSLWHALDGVSNISSVYDLIAEWIEPEDTPAPLPYGHVRLPSGDVVDLTSIREPFGLLQERSPETAEALKLALEPYEYWHGEHWLDHVEGDQIWPEFVYRVAPKPAAPREGWVPALHPTRRACKVAHPGCEPVFVKLADEGETE